MIHSQIPILLAIGYKIVKEIGIQCGEVNNYYKLGEIKMKLVDIDGCDRKLFYKQMDGKDSLITVEAAFNMLMALPVVTESEIYNKAIDDYNKELKEYLRKFTVHYVSDKDFDYIAEQLKGEEYEQTTD